MKSINAFKIFVLMTGLLFIACTEENPDLVNPPSGAKTVLVRFFNLASDQSPYKLNMDDTESTDIVEYGNICEAIHPTADSVIMSILDGSETQMVRTQWRTKMIRETYFTVFYLPVINDTTTDKSDSIFIMSSIVGLPDETKTARLKLCNVNTDTDYKWSLTLGCPNGEAIASKLTYKQVSSLSDVRADIEKGLAVSVSKYSSDTLIDSKLYNLKLTENHQYAVVVFKAKDGSDAIYLLDEYEQTLNALQDMEEIPEQTTDIRVVNMSSGDVNVSILGGDVIATNAAPDYISSYNSITVCQSETMDTIFTEFSNGSVDSLAASLEVLEQYTLFVFNEDNSQTLLAAPVIRQDTLDNFSSIRVINANPDYENINVVLGARDTMFFKTEEGESSFASGEKIAPNVAYMNISDPVIMSDGPAPIAFFQTLNPDKLLYTSVTEFEAGMDYILVLTKDVNKNDVYYMIEENESEISLTPLEEGVFINIINARPGTETINIQMDPVLLDANLYLESTLSTIVPLSTTSIIIDGVTLNFTPELGRRFIVIATGTADNPSAFASSSEPMGAETYQFRQRTLHASTEVDFLTVRYDSETGDIFANSENLGFMDYSTIEVKELNRPISLYFMDSETDEALTRRSLARAFGKNYIVVFAGGKINEDKDKDGFDDGYIVVEVQEF